MHGSPSTRSTRRGSSIAVAASRRRRIDEALRFVEDKGLTFHWGEKERRRFRSQRAAREQLRDYLAVLDMIGEFKADCLGWQYQLGLIPLRPPSDLAEGLFNSTCRPESDGDTIACATEADQGNVIPMELMKRLLKRKGCTRRSCSTTCAGARSTRGASLGCS